MKQLSLLRIGCLVTINVFSQDSMRNELNIFDNIGKAMSGFKADTSAAPNDEITMKIIELRAVKGH